MSEESKHYLDSNGHLVYNDVKYPTHPTTGYGWTENSANAYVEQQEAQAVDALQAQIDDNAKAEAEKFTGHIVFEEPTVEEGTGHVLQALNPLAPFDETTVTLGSVLKLVANIQTDPEDASSVLSNGEVPDDIFRVPLRNTATGEVRLFAGLLESGVITIEAPLDTAGYWETTEALINSRIPEGYWFRMETKVFSVVYSSDTVNAKVTG